MGKVTYTMEQTIGKLREVEKLRTEGHTLTESIRLIGVTEQTYYRWRKLYGKMTLEEAKKLRHLEKENNQLKKIVADLSVDNAILKNMAAISGRF